MRRKRRSARSGVSIDLTSLLDVIFILLLVVICSYASVKQNNQQKIIQAKESQSNAESAARLYNDMIETQDDLQKYVWAASIIAPYTPDKITSRQIRVLTEDTEIISVPLEGIDVEEGIQEFKRNLTGYIEDHVDEPVILSLNEQDDKILYRDEKRINEILEELRRTYSNVYIKGSGE